MDRQPKLTPRAKGAQIAPNDSSTLVSVHDIGLEATSDRVAPFEPGAAKTTTNDVASQVQLLVRTSGRAAFKDNFYLYMRTLIPIGIASVWMFAMYAVFSYLVPNVLCKQTSIELSGSPLGISSCVYVTDGKYSPYDGAKIFWLIFWSLQAAWVALFPGFIAKAIFGSCMSRLQMLVTLVVTAGCLATPIVTALVYGMALNNFYVLGASGLGSLIVVVACAPAAVRFTGNKLMKWRFIFLFAFAGQINTIYLFIIPRLITAQAQQALGGMGLTVVRLFVHPVVWTVTLFFFRTVQRHIGRVKDCTQTCFIIWPLLYSSLYGRFLLLQLESVGSVVVLNFMFACFHIAGQLDNRGSDSWWLSLLYGERAKDAMQATKVVDEMEFVNQLATNMMEGASILAASALLSFGGVATSPGVPPDNKLIWFNAAIQLVTTFVFNFFEQVACGKFHNLEWRKVYPRSTVRLLSYVMVVLAIGGARLCIELLLLFCPKYYDQYGILMEQCDKPSLFQVISLSLGNPRKGAAEETAAWLGADLVNGTWVRSEL